MQKERGCTGHEMEAQIGTERKCIYKRDSR